MKFFLILKQASEGCEAECMIACGTQCMPLTSTDRDAALAESVEFLSDPDNGFFSGEFELKSATVVAFAAQVDLQRIHQKLEHARLMREHAEEEARERRELERLKNKYGA